MTAPQIKLFISIVRQSYRQHEYDMRGISKFRLFSFKSMEETLKYTLYKVIQVT